MCFQQPPGYPKRDERDLLPYWVDVQADQSLHLLHVLSSASELSKARDPKRDERDLLSYWVGVQADQSVH